MLVGRGLGVAIGLPTPIRATGIARPRVQTAGSMYPTGFKLVAPHLAVAVGLASGDGPSPRGGSAAECVVPTAGERFGDLNRADVVFESEAE